MHHYPASLLKRKAGGAFWGVVVMLLVGAAAFLLLVQDPTVAVAVKILTGNEPESPALGTEQSLIRPPEPPPRPTEPVEYGLGEVHLIVTPPRGEVTVTEVESGQQAMHNSVPDSGRVSYYKLNGGKEYQLHFKAPGHHSKKLRVLSGKDGATFDEAISVRLQPHSETVVFRTTPGAIVTLTHSTGLTLRSSPASETGSITLEKVPEGSYTYRVVMKQHQPFEGQITEVKMGRKLVLEAPLTPLPGRLKFSGHQDVTIQVNGTIHRTNSEFTLAPGAHSLEFRRPGFDPVHRVRKVAPAEIIFEQVPAEINARVRVDISLPTAPQDYEQAWRGFEDRSFTDVVGADIQKALNSREELRRAMVRLHKITMPGVGTNRLAQLVEEVQRHEKLVEQSDFQATYVAWVARKLVEVSDLINYFERIRKLDKVIRYLRDRGEEQSASRYLGSQWEELIVPLSLNGNDNLESMVAQYEDRVRKLQKALEGLNFLGRSEDDIRASQKDLTRRTEKLGRDPMAIHLVVDLAEMNAYESEVMADWTEPHELQAKTQALTLWRETLDRAEAALREAVGHKSKLDQITKTIESERPDLARTNARLLNAYDEAMRTLAPIPDIASYAKALAHAIRRGEELIDAPPEP